MRNPLCRIVLLLGIVCTAPAWAQLTEADLAELRARGQEEGWTFTVGPNPATNLPREQLCGLVEPEGWQASARFDPCLPTRDLPASFDWRAVTGCPPIRNQGGCGSCWAFATVGALECNVLIVDGEVVDISEQWLVSCNDDGWGCGGGWFAHEYHDSKTDPCGGTGAVMETHFPYTATDELCACPYPHRYFIDNWAYVGGGGTPSVAAIKQAILDHGPVSVACYVDDAFQGYTGGVFNDCAWGSVNHGVVLVGWDDNQGDDGVWFMRNSWGAGWGEGGYMRIAYDCSRIGYAACYVNFNGSPEILFDYPDGRPLIAGPHGTTFRVNIGAESGAILDGSPMVRWSANGGVWQTLYMTEIGDGEYEAYLPPAYCFSKLNWYVRVQHSFMGLAFDPKDAPNDTYASLVATGTEIQLADSFEDDLGWTVVADADAGNWERAEPEEVASGEWTTQPGEDHTIDGTLCFVTGASAGAGPTDFDVDGGPTHLISPVLNLAGSDALISYWRWFHMSAELDDELLVSVSNNDGATWTHVESVTETQGWTEVTFRVGEVVTPSALVRVRFTVDDSPNNTLLEALIDDFAVERLICILVGDLNCNAWLGFDDINPFVLAISNPAAYEAAYPDCDRMLADVNGDGVADFKDINAFVQLLAD